jgi:hypothetical protein
VPSAASAAAAAGAVASAVVGPAAAAVVAAAAAIVASHAGNSKAKGRKFRPFAFARQNMACDALTRAAARGKNQKAKGQTEHTRDCFAFKIMFLLILNRLSSFLPFASCLLPFAFIYEASLRAWP